MTRQEVISGLTKILIDADLSAEHAAAIDYAIEYLKTSFFNEDASREIDRLTVELKKRNERICELEGSWE